MRNWTAEEMASEPITGVEREPQRGPEVGVQGDEAPLKLKTF